MPKRKVLLDPPENSKHIDKVDEDLIYAAYAEGDGHIVFITKGEHTYKTSWTYAGRMMNHNYERKDLKVLIREMISDDYTVYEFEDEFELAQWLIEIYA